MSKRWDWQCMLPSNIFNQLALDGWPGWDKDKNGTPYSVYLEIASAFCHSHNIAVVWDGLTINQFHYRDFTKSGLPFIDDGEYYNSLFSFQRKTDATQFLDWIIQYDGVRVLTEVMDDTHEVTR